MPPLELCDSATIPLWLELSTRIAYHISATVRSCILYLYVNMIGSSAACFRRSYPEQSALLSCSHLHTSYLCTSLSPLYSLQCLLVYGLEVNLSQRIVSSRRRVVAISFSSVFHNRQPTTDDS